MNETTIAYNSQKSGSLAKCWNLAKSISNAQSKTLKDSNLSNFFSDVNITMTNELFRNFSPESWSSVIASKVHL